MFDLVPTIETHAQQHPLRVERKSLHAPAGSTVAEIVRLADLDPRFGPPVVILKRGLEATILPMDAWGRVKPKIGTQVLIHYDVEGPAAGALLASLVSAAAPTIASTLLGASASAFALSLATAAITVVGGLLVNALIPPPEQPGAGTQDPAQQTITGTQNRSDPFGPIPKPLGRRQIFPKRAAKGYTVTTGEGEIEFRGRYILGWGPLCISDLRIGTTAITDFDDIEVEFLNVDQTETLARQPGLSSITKAWRTGTQAMTLYPDNVAEDGYSVELAQSTPVVRRTRTDTESAAIDVTFLAGLFRQRQTVNERDTKTATFDFRYREVGEVSWVSAGTLSVTSKQNSQFRKTHKITFPEPGEYDIEITQTSANIDQSNHFDTATLSAIRSFRPGSLPSHEGVAEIAIRIRATDQLNGQVDSLNCIAHQMCRVWTGSAWSAPTVTRHPAWILADWLQGAHMRRPVPDSRMDLAALKAWADDESHWTCDLVVENMVRVREIADIICPTGRAKFALTDLRYSVIREKPSDPIRQLITPRNSWGFKGKIVFPKEIHALRCIVASERQNWREDEVIVYMDGFNAGNATKFEEIRFPGVVLTDDDTDQNNVYRLGRYHLAVTELRREEMSVNMDFEHLQVQRGDPVLVVHDVPSVGLGSARIKGITASGSTLTSITLDDVFPGASGTHRIVVRTQYGDIVEFQASAPADETTKVWTYVSGTIDATDLSAGDLVVLQETSEAKFEALITGVRRGANDTAVVSFVPRAPAVTEAADGTIPDYDPIVTGVTGNADAVPAAPSVEAVLSNLATALLDADGRPQARILVRLEGLSVVRATATSVQLRWRPVNEETWEVGEPAPVGTLSLLTRPLQAGVAYQVQVRSLSRTERPSEWVEATASTIASVSPGKLPATVTNVAASGFLGFNSITWDAVTEFADGEENPYLWRYNLYASQTDDFATASIVWRGEGTLAQHAGLGLSEEWFYWVRAQNFGGTEGAVSTSASATTNGALVDGQDGLSVAQLVIYRRASSAPATPTGGSFNFDTKALTPPTDWSVAPPAGTDTLYASYGTASVEGTAGTDSSITWSSPAASGIDGTSGKSTYQAVVFRRAATAPATPTGGSFNFSTEVLTPPSGWSVSPPSGSDPLYAVRYLFSITGDTGTATAGTWSAPAIFVQDGSDGISTFQLSVFRRAASAPATPTGGSYNFDTQAITPPSGWSATVPAGSDPLYVASTLASITGTTGTDSSLTWSTPRIIAKDGNTGDTGDRGAGRWYIGVALGNLPIESTADNRWNDGTGNQPTRPVVGDQAIFYTGTISNQTEQRAFICTSVTSDTVHTWNRQEEFIDGDLLVAGTLTADKLVLDGTTLEGDGSGNLIIKNGGVNTAQLTDNSVTDYYIRDRATYDAPSDFWNRNIEWVEVDSLGGAIEVGISFEQDQLTNAIDSGDPSWRWRIQEGPTGTGTSGRTTLVQRYNLAETWAEGDQYFNETIVIGSPVSGTRRYAFDFFAVNNLNAPTLRNLSFVVKRIKK